MFRRSSKEPRPQVGASSKEKAEYAWGLTPQTNIGHSSPCTARGILAFSRKRKTQGDRNVALNVIGAYVGKLEGFLERNRVREGGPFFVAKQEGEGPEIGCTSIELALAISLNHMK